MRHTAVSPSWPTTLRVCTGATTRRIWGPGFKSGLKSAVSRVCCRQSLSIGGGSISTRAVGSRRKAISTAGLDIKNRGVDTHVYVLSDFDPAGDTIYKTLAHGSKATQGGLSRFAGGVPVHVHKLALTHEQVKEMALPTRPAKRSDSRSRRFIERFGDISVELDAIPPNHLRGLVDAAISQHMSERQLKAIKEVEAEERLIAKIGISDAKDDIAWARQEMGAK